MRVLLALLATSTLLAPSLAEANCAASFVRTFPENRATGVPTDTHIVLDIGDTRGVARSWAASGAPAFVLTTLGERPVRLQVVFESAGGDGFRDQRTLVLAPERPLSPAKHYSLGGRAMSALHATLRFTTGRAVDGVAPTLRSAHVEPFVAAEYGCGPAHEIPIAVDGADNGAGPLFAHLRLASSEADRAARRFVAEVITPVVDGRTFLGHGMCFGNYPLEPGQRFVAELTLVDGSFVESATPVTLALAAD